MKRKELLEIDSVDKAIVSWDVKEAFVKVAKTTDIPIGAMKHVEVEGTEILIANVKGKFYAVCDRCPHLNAMLSMGTLVDSIVTCPRHFSSFDVTTGKLSAGPNNLYLPVYTLKVEGSDLLVGI